MTLELRLFEILLNQSQSYLNMTPNKNILMTTSRFDKHQLCLIKIQLELSATHLHDQEEIKSQVQIASISIYFCNHFTALSTRSFTKNFLKIN